MTSPSVTLLGTWPPIPGISAYCFELAQALGQVTSLEYLTFSHLYPNFLYPGGPVPNDSTFPDTPPGVRSLRRSLAWYNPLGWVYAGLSTKTEILHVQFWSLPAAPPLLTVMAAARTRGTRCVLTVHNLAEHERRKGMRAALLAALRLSDAAIVHQPDPPQWFQSACVQCTKRQPSHIPHGVLNLYASNPQSSQTARATLDIPADARVILFFGAIRPYKGLDLLLTAFGSIASRHPSAHLVIAGRPWEPWQRYQSMIDNAPWNNRVHLHLDYIPTEQVQTFFQAADLVVLPYREFDAQSGVAMAAAAFAKPLVVSRVGALPLLQPDTDFIVPPNDAPALAATLKHALQDPDRLHALQIAAQKVAQEHNWQHIAQATLDLYRLVLSSPSAET